MALQERLREEGRRLGFARIGFASARESSGAARLKEWLGRDLAGGMDWMHRRVTERSDPTRLVEWARTLILATLSYSDAAGGSYPAARISRYARGPDYHRVLKRRLGRLIGFLLAAAPGARAVSTVDTGALLEKAWAVEAGLGWAGKHTNVIDPERGSWLFIGAILTDLPLPADPEPVFDRCGTCTRCLEACPTGAFPQPYLLDSRRCISYLTIEHRGPIPEELRAGMGEWVFGCDVCQEVCPWNSDPAPGDAELDGSHRAADLADLLRLSREEFNRRFTGTAIRRTGWSRFLRNVAVALGNSGDSRAIPALTEALAIPDPLIREHVAWALDRLRAPRSDAGSPAGERE